MWLSEKPFNLFNQARADRNAENCVKEAEFLTVAQGVTGPYMSVEHDWFSKQGHQPQ